MEAPQNENWKFGQKSPSPDNLLLSAIHNLLHKNSISSMGKQKHKGISQPDFEKAFSGRTGVGDGVAELFNELSEIEFEKPDLRKVKRNIGRDDELFGMLTSLADKKNDFLQ